MGRLRARVDAERGPVLLDGLGSAAELGQGSPQVDAGFGTLRIEIKRRLVLLGGLRPSAEPRQGVSQVEARLKCLGIVGIAPQGRLQLRDAGRELSLIHI